MENFFNDEIEKVVFISEEQLCNLSVKKLYGRYWEDTFIYNLFPVSLCDKGDLLCDVLKEGANHQRRDFVR